MELQKLFSIKMKTCSSLLFSALLLAVCLILVHGEDTDVDIDEVTQNCDGDCTTSNCGSGCVNNCRSSSDCTSCSDCVRPCVQSCGNSACRRRCSTNCRRNCASPQPMVPAAVTPVKQIIEVPDRHTEVAHPTETKNDVANNVTTTFELTSVVHNNNTIHIPVTHNFHHVSNVHVIPPSAPTISINISSVNPPAPIYPTYPPAPVYPTYPPRENHTEHYKEVERTCCTIVPPKQCYYNSTNHINCDQKPQKVCGDICTSPLVMQHPTPTYIPVPVPVERHHIQQVPVPQPMPVYYPMPIVHRVNVPQPYPVNQYIPYPQQVPVQAPCQSQPNINWYQQRFFNVPQVSPCHQQQEQNSYVHHQSFQQQQLQQQQQQVLQLQPLLPPVQPHPQQVLQLPPIQPQPIQTVQPQIAQVQQTCPISIWNGVKYPTCRSVSESQQFIGTKSHFLLDQYQSGQNTKSDLTCKTISQYPYIQCYKQNIQDCKNCVYCDGNYNPQKCMYAQHCSADCQRAMIDLNLPERMGRTLNCQLINTAVKCT